MSLKTPVELRKGRSGEKVFAVALFLTLVVAAAVAWFVVGPNGGDADKAFQSAHEGYRLAASDAVTRLSIDFEYLSVRCAASSPMRLDFPPEALSLRTIARGFGVFETGGKAVLPDMSAFAPQNPALQSARNSPYRHDVLFARSPFTGEKAILFTAAFEASGETFVLVMEAEDALFADHLLRDDPERNDILLIVTQDGSVIAANQKRTTISNLIAWAEEAAAEVNEPTPLYVSIRDRIAGFSICESEKGAFRLAYSPISGTDWMLCQIEFVE